MRHSVSEPHRRPVNGRRPLNGADQAPAVLHMLCGKIAAGKSTLAAELARKPGTILIAEDEWLSTLFSDQMHSVADYVAVSEKLRRVMGPHISMLLMSGLSVVLDFPANTVKLRCWMRDVFDDVGADHRLHYLNLPEDICMQRLRARNQAGAHQFAASDAQFHQISAWFEPPSDAEGFTIVPYQTDIM
ncbi:ATP-binding protein [Thalassospira sp. GB04J01]|uniref:AAA family ATPase n=1 Tax=Thalassospira sp. GB04J01 TaxID=1485225 RepID=UPI000C9C29AE|nr:ATP-binding protein [Thalassospira sp. GB04J01]